MTRLDEIEARANAATEGPWEAEGGFVLAHSAANGVVATCDNPLGDDYEDAEFIVSARTDVPALVKALRAVLDLHRTIRVSGAGGHTYDVCQTCNQTAPCAYARTIHQHLGEDT